MTLNNSSRIIAKHKAAEFIETSKSRPIVDISQLKVLEDAELIANEWVTNNRLTNTLSHFKPEEIKMENFGVLLKYLVDDIFKESGGEIVITPKVRKAISKRAASLIKQHLTNINNI